MVTLSGEQRASLLQWKTAFLNAFANGFEHRLSTELPFYSRPPEVVKFTDEINAMAEQLAKRQPIDGPTEVDSGCLPALKTVVLHQRRELASQLDEPRERTSHPAILQALDDRLKPFEDLMRQEWFQQTTALQIPRLSDFLALERVEKLSQDYSRLPGRQFDEKFHILQAAALVRTDLRYFRQACGLRGCSVTLAYVDIDNFKQFNTKYGESAVDLRILPVFMRELEACVFFRGYAYRQGGDEYIVLLPNVDGRMSLPLLNDIRRRLEALSYGNVDERTTVSIGVCVVDPECFLTEREVEERANRAKNHAKEKGRNCIVAYHGSLFRDEDLYVASPSTERVHE